MDTTELSVFCYDCDDFIINDTKDRNLEKIRSVIVTRNLATRQTEESESSRKSLRARRKRPVTNAKQTKSLVIGKSDDKSIRKRVGLKNLGNTCFMNSVLQSLSNIEEFCNVLTTLPSLHDQIQKSKDAKKVVEKKLLNDGIIVTDELKKVLSALIQSEEKTAISPENLFQAIWQVVPRFKGYQQQDAHEFLRYTLDRLHTELLALLPPGTTSTSSVLGNPKRSKLCPSAQSLVTSIFGGSLQSCVTCLTCRQTSITHDPFLDLSVAIPPIFTGPPRKPKEGEKTVVCHLHSCLQKYVEMEELGESERLHCRVCSSKQPSTKQFAICRLPTVLCIHVKRFRWSAYARSKLDTFIEFPLRGLDMSAYTLHNPGGTRFNDPGSSLYDLAAVIVHHGTGAGAGHYTAFATNNQAWFNFNDCHVKEADFQTVMSSKAYILFYVQRNF